MCRYLYSTCESIHFSLVYMQGEYVLKVDPRHGWTFSKYMGTVRSKSKQGNTTNLNISFSMENEKRAAQVGDALPTEVPRQLSWLIQIKAIQGKRATSLT